MNEQNLINLKDRTEEERKAIASKGGTARASLYKDIKRQEQEIKVKEQDFYNSIKGETLYKTLTHYLKSPKDIIFQKPHLIGHEGQTKLYSDYVIDRGIEEHHIIMNILDQAHNEDTEEGFKWNKLILKTLKDAEQSELKNKKLMLDYELKKEQLELKRQTKLKELELREREIAVKETLIKLKNKGIIDGVITKEEEKAINNALNNELIKAIDEVK